MKILQINTLFTPRRYGGAEVFLERYAAELIARGHDVQVACLSPTPEEHGGDGPRVREFDLRNVYWPFDGQHKSRWLKAVWHLRNSFGRGGAADIDRLLAQEQPDLVHTHNLSGFTSSVWQIIHARRIPLIHTIHDYSLLCPSTTMFRRDANCTAQCLGCRLLSLPKAGHSQAVNAVVGCSRFVLERHLRGGYFERATQHVIHNGDPTGTQSPAGERCSQTKALRVGYLGRLAASKGIELMLDSLAPLAPAQCEMLVAGAGDAAYESSLKDRYERHGVKFLGRVDASKFLSGIDVLVVPSLWHEPFGLVLCEAMTAGVPIVASAVGGIPEIVEDGKCGFLFDPSNGQSLRQHVSHLASDRELHRQMAAACRQKAESCRFEHTVESYLRVYDQTLN